MNCDRFWQESGNQAFISKGFGVLLHRGDTDLERESFVSKKFTLEVIVQVAGSLGTKSLDTNQIFSLRDSSVFAFTNTDLKPLINNFKRIKHQFSGVITYKAF